MFSASIFSPTGFRSGDAGISLITIPDECSSCTASESGRAVASVGLRDGAIPTTIVVDAIDGFLILRSLDELEGWCCRSLLGVSFGGTFGCSLAALSSNSRLERRLLKWKHAAGISRAKPPTMTPTTIPIVAPLLKPWPR